VSYFIQVIRMVVLKGSGLRDITPQLLAMLAFALFFNGWAVLNYKKRGA
jgi:ABC-2 type transport system permease protein